MEDKKRSGSKKKMLLKMVFSSILRRKSRMVVALLAVAIGATILSGLMTIYYDIPRQMGKEFRSYGANMILLPKDEQPININKIDEIKEIIKDYDLEGITPFGYKNTKVNEQPVVLSGTDFNEILKTRPFWQLEGEIPSSDNEILVGTELADILYLQIGKTIKLEYKDSTGLYIPHNLTVSGIVESGKSEDSMMFIDINKLAKITNDDNVIDVIEISLSAEKEVLNNILNTYDATDIVKAKLVKKVADSENTVLSKLQALVWLVSIIVLVLTMISVGTTMMAAVMERREEIGLKKAIGAPNKSIILEFLYEGLFLGAIGGVFGMLLGFLFAQEVSLKVFGRGISIQPMIAIITIIMSIIITGIASLIPVKRATEIDPALVLKGE